MQHQSSKLSLLVVVIAGSLAIACDPDSEPESGEAGPNGMGGPAADSGGFTSNDAAVIANFDATVGPADAGRGSDSGTSAVDSGGRPAEAGMTVGGGGSTGAGGAAVKSAGCGSTMGPKSATYMISAGGMNRTYILRVPDNYDANRPYRLILSYHPLGGTAQQISSGNFYGLWSMSNGSTIFAAPQGIGNGWSDSGRSRTMGGQDIALTKAIVDELTSKLCIDTSRIFAEGFSMGGSMSYAIACALPDVVRGVVAHSGGPMSGCMTHTKPVAYFMTHGTTDNVCTYPGYGVPQVNDFAKVNGCMPREMPTPSGTAPSCVDYEGCMPGYPARACIFVGGHTPSPSGNWVPKESWQFISQF
jgi:polyhydroxybutyrate depolymerase